MSLFFLIMYADDWFSFVFVVLGVVHFFDVLMVREWGRTKELIFIDFQKQTISNGSLKENADSFTNTLV